MVPGQLLATSAGAESLSATIDGPGGTAVLWGGTVAEGGAAATGGAVATGGAGGAVGTVEHSVERTPCVGAVPEEVLQGPVDHGAPGQGG